jgi:hypothetical protein
MWDQLGILCKQGEIMSIDLWLFLLGLLLFAIALSIAFIAPRRKDFYYICPDATLLPRTVQQISPPENQTQQIRTEDQ